MTQSEAQPKTIKVHQTAGTGMDIEWKDGHHSTYSFVFLRDACPCALCNEEREKDGRRPGDPLKPVGGALPMFKAAGQADQGRAGGQVRHSLRVERRARARHLFLGVPAGTLSLRRVQGASRHGSSGCREQAELKDAHSGFVLA